MKEKSNYLASRLALKMINNPRQHTEEDDIHSFLEYNRIIHTHSKLSMQLSTRCNTH